eukprot:11173869-Prorocentrum_lima.AAC.1
MLHAVSDLAFASTVAIRPAGWRRRLAPRQRLRLWQRLGGTRHYLDGLSRNRSGHRFGLCQTG